MVSLILAVIGGFIATTILVVITTMLSAKLMLSSTTVGAAPPASFSVVSLTLGFIAAFVGGWLAVQIAPGEPSAPKVLAGLIGGLGLISAVGTPVEKRNGQPGWYLFLLPVTGALGALFGGGVLP